MEYIKKYISAIDTVYKTGVATEHSYRSALKTLMEEAAKDTTATNEPKRIECGAPDFIVTRNDLPLGYIECKDIDKELNKIEKSSQLKRYLYGLGNLILTNYLEFRLYKNGQRVHKVVLAEESGGKIRLLKDNMEAMAELLEKFSGYEGHRIESSEKLAEMMAGKAILMKEFIGKILKDDEKDNTLHNQLDAFKKILIHDITEETFADVYAQTITYGMFAAIIHDKKPNDFSRRKAAELIPQSNPFLRKLFQYIAGYDLDERLKWLVDALAELLRATDIGTVMKDFGRSSESRDPVIHFYETFLAKYDPKLRKSRGVYYTPEPVVQFMVKAVDDILKDEFGLSEGLADRSLVEIEVDTQKTDKRRKDQIKKIKREVHRVQILDPATGTGTFLAEVIRQIYGKMQGMKGAWPNYIEEHLKPRINGFEILMASYAMCHLKLELLLKDTGYEQENQKRFQVYLTNSLEEPHADTGTLFAQWLSREAEEANEIKKKTPVMVVLGNPPYSGESQNKGEWIIKLMEDYKKEPGGKVKLKERNPKWINDDYVKFMRFGQHFIEKNKEGILAFINNHGFLDNPTFRGMRWHLLKTYDKIYVIDLHGNSKKKETCPDGSKDENVFDIQQGVSINILVKTGQKGANELGRVYHYDLYGKRQEKYDFLLEHDLKDLPLTELQNKKKMYFMVQKDYELEEEYNKGMYFSDLFKISNVGIVTSRDHFVTNNDEAKLENKIKKFFELEKSELQQIYHLKENKSWKIDDVKCKAKKFDNEYIKQVNYRPFDVRFIYYNVHFVERNRKDVMQHFLRGENVGLVYKLGNSELNSSSTHIAKNIIDFRSWSRPGMQGGDYVSPLYLYPDAEELGDQRRIPNLNMDIVNKIASGLELEFTEEKEDRESTFAPIDLLDYIYAVLHSPAYREKYKEFLKIDFPRVPYPADAATFRQMAELGAELRSLHLMESPALAKLITEYPVSGDDEVRNKIVKKDFLISGDTGRVMINESQYFDKVPVAAWEFYIGGYQPAQKWLKDRHGRKLTYNDIEHYQKIIVALTETGRIMKEIDTVFQV